MMRSFSWAVPFALLLSLGCDDGQGTVIPPGQVGVGSATGTGGDPAGTGGEPAVVDPSTPVGRYGQLSVVGNQIVDQTGTPVQLRGVSTQWLNYDALYAGNRNGMVSLRDEWGIDVYRLANGVEGFNGYAEDPERRLAVVKQMIELAIAEGLYVIVDWHTHEEQYQALAQAFFTEIATSYGNLPNIIYEDFNEPIDQPWSTVIKPYHEALVSTIRSIDPDNVIIMGTGRWSQNVDIAAGDPVAGTNLAYTVHFYSCSHQAQVRSKAQTALDAGLALFITEWGATHADGGTAANAGLCTPDADVWHDFLDLNKIGSAAWKLNSDTDSSALLVAGAPATGGWTDAQISPHGQYVRGVLARP